MHRLGPFAIIIFCISCSGLTSLEFVLGDEKTADSADDQPPDLSVDSAEEEVQVFFNTYHWSGVANVANGLWIGEEWIKVALQQPQADLLNCDLVWDIVGVQSEASACDNCLFTYDLTATPKLNEGQQDGTCDSDWGQTLSFSYAYTEEYAYPGEMTGNPALLVNDGLGWSVGILEGHEDENIPDYENRVTWDASTGDFSYSAGYINFEFVQ